jgi:hypothetical protein
LQFLPFGSIPFRSTLASLIPSLSLFALFLTFPSPTEGEPFLPWKRAGCAVAIALSSFATLSALRPEVYAFAAFLTVSSAFLAVRNDPRAHASAWFLFGLSVATHPVISLAALPFLISQDRLRQSPFALLGLCSWLYLPLRASVGASWNFGDPVRWDRLVGFLQAKMYKVYDHPDLSVAAANVLKIVRMYASDLTLFGFLAAMVGMAVLLARSGKGGWRVAISAALLLFPLAGMGNFWPENPDASGYLLAGAWGAGLLAIEGIRRIERGFSGSLRRCLSVLSWVWIGAWGFSIGSDYWVERRMNLDWSAQRHLENLLLEPPARSLVDTASFSTFSFLRYGQLAEGMRPDLAVTYRGLEESFDFPMAAKRTVIWEAGIERDRAGNYTLQKGDLARARGSVSRGWFFEAKTAREERRVDRLRSSVSGVLSEMPGGMSWRREALLLNYVLHILAARAKGESDEETRIREELKELFPTFDGYDLLSVVL